MHILQQKSMFLINDKYMFLKNSVNIQLNILISLNNYKIFSYSLKAESYTLMFLLYLCEICLEYLLLVHDNIVHP